MSTNWRGHVGLMMPTPRGRGFGFWYRHLPVGVQCSPAVIGFRTGERQTFDDGEKTFDRLEQLGVDLCYWGSDIISVSGSPPFILRGAGHERSWRAEMQGKLEVPIVTGMAPHVSAAEALGVSRIAILTHYGEDLNSGIARYFEERGIRTTLLSPFSLGDTEGLFSTSLRDLSAISWEQVYLHCRRSLRDLGDAVDGIYINGGGWEVAPALEYLEADLGVPVVWAIAAELWLTLALLDIGDPVKGVSRLLRDSALRRHPVVEEWRLDKTP